MLGCSGELVLSKGKVIDLSDETLLTAQFSKRGRLVLVIDYQGQVSIYSTDDFEKIFEVSKQEKLDESKHAVLSDDGSKLLLANDNEVAIWSVYGKKLIGQTRFEGVQSFASISAISVSPNNDRILVGMSDGTINMATISTRLNNRFKPHARAVTHLKFTTDDNYFSASEDGKFAKRVFASPEPIFEEEFPHRVTSMVVDFESQRLFVSDALKSQLIKSLTRKSNLSIQLQYIARFMVFRQGHFINHANLLVTSSSKNHISIWDTTTGVELGTWQSLVETSTSTVLSMYSNEKGELFTINTDALIEKWDLTQLDML